MGVIGVATSGANARAAVLSRCRAQVDAIGPALRGTDQAAALDAKVHELDQQLAASRRRAAALRPVATAEAVQLYENSSGSFTVLLDTTSAMESARRAELISRATDHTQALLDEFRTRRPRFRTSGEAPTRPRAAQAAVVSGLAKQESALEHALARAPGVPRTVGGPGKGHADLDDPGHDNERIRHATAARASGTHHDPAAGPGSGRSPAPAVERRDPPQRPVPPWYRAPVRARA